MLRIPAIFFLLLLTMQLSGEVWFVPGWRTGFDNRRGSVIYLGYAYPGQQIKVCSWDSCQPWGVTKNNAEEFKSVLFAQVASLPEPELRELILVGHSIGGDIVLDILSKLQTGGKKIHSAALLGAAVPCDDPRIYSALNAVRFELCNIYNPNDWVLKLFYPLGADAVAPLGYAGWAGSHPRFYEMEGKGELEPINFCKHFAYSYINDLRPLLKSLPARVTVIQDAPNTERIPADNIFWENVELHKNWKLQKHYDSRARIIDPQGIRRASGSMEKMRKSFENIKSQLR